MDSVQLTNAIQVSSIAYAYALLAVDLIFIVVVPIIAGYKLRMQQTSVNVWVQMLIMWLSFGFFIMRDFDFINNMDNCTTIGAYVNLYNG